MDRVTTTEALRILQERGLTVSYPTVARWVQNGLFEGAERVEETRGPVWMIPRASVMKFTPPKPTGRPPKAKTNGTAKKRSGKK
jgi:hypothetical protein